MFKKEIVIEIVEQILEALKTIKRRSKNINTPDDFLNSDNG